MKKQIELVNDRVYPFKVEQHTEGWPKAGFDREMAEMQVRMVDGKAQVEIGIYRYKSGRTYTTIASFELPPEIVAKLVETLTN